MQGEGPGADQGDAGADRQGDEDCPESARQAGIRQLQGEYSRHTCCLYPNIRCLIFVSGSVSLCPSLFLSTTPSLSGQRYSLNGITLAAEMKPCLMIRGCRQIA